LVDPFDTPLTTFANSLTAQNGKGAAMGNNTQAKRVTALPDAGVIKPPSYTPG